MKWYQKFEEHCIPCKNETHEVCAFNQGTEECEITEGDCDQSKPILQV